MSNSATPDYKLRPNKAVDRELFLSLLGRLAALLKIENHTYVGLGGPFLDDFRLIHSRLGIAEMVCVEREQATHLRQKFNAPFDSITLKQSTIEDYLDKREFVSPVILWLDYTQPDKRREQIDCFCQQVTSLPVGSVVRLTLNASPATLGSPSPNEVRNDILGENMRGKPTLQEWRLARLTETLGEYVPTDTSPDDLITKRFGPCLLRICRLAVERSLEGYSNRAGVWALASHYSDGQPMVTATIVIAAVDDEKVRNAIESWPYYTSPEAPHILELPALSALERLTLEQSEEKTKCFDFELPKANLAADPLKAFETYYRVYPHFARIDL